VATFVLVHGAWHGAWCWTRVADRLLAKGHAIVAPTLTGLCERSHLLSPAVDLQTHVLDIVNTVKWLELNDIVLVGHSYGGMVVSGAAEALKDRISAIVLVDAFLPSDGQSVFDLQSSAARDAILAAVGDGKTTLPPRPSALFNVNAADQAWVDAQCTAQPIQAFLQPVALTGARDRIARRTYIRAADYPSEAFDRGLSSARAQGWRTITLAGGHDLMLDSPQQLTALLEETAGGVEGHDLASR
jgi:pimeloyl-ACP methyl ester carboxylesterase